MARKILRVFIVKYKECEEKWEGYRRSIVSIDRYRLRLDPADLDDVDLHFLNDITTHYFENKEQINSPTGYTGVWLLAFKEFMWRIGYEVQFADIDSEEERVYREEFDRRNTLGWTDMRKGYPRYEHRE